LRADVKDDEVRRSQLRRDLSKQRIDLAANGRAASESPNGADAAFLLRRTPLRETPATRTPAATKRRT